MKQYNLTTLVVCMLMLAIGASDGYAQLSNTLFFDKNNYRNHYLNPAERFNGQFFINVPLYAPYVALENGKADRELCSLMDMYPRDMKAMFWLQDINLADGRDFAQSSAWGTAWSLGYVTKRNAFLTMDLSLRSEAWAEVPDNFNDALFKGLSDGGNDLSGFESQSQLWAQASLTYARNIGKKISVGISAKYLYGLAAMKTDLKSLHLDNTEYDARLYGESEIFICSPGLEIMHTESGIVYNIDESTNTFKNYTPKGRSGLAADIGVTYNVLKNLKLSASVLDLGFINWKIRHAYRMTTSNEHFYGAPQTGQLTSLSEIKKTLTLMDDNTLKANLVPKIYAGAEYALWKDRIGLGAIYKSRIYPNRTANEIILSANLRMLKKLTLAAAYTMPDYTANSLDVSLMASLDVLNIYLSVDNIAKAGKFDTGDIYFLQPSDNSTIRVSAGIGFAFKKISKKKALQKIEYDNSGATITVTGKVTSRNPKTGQEAPLAGVSITQAGTTNGTLSDADGNYRISVPTGAALVFKYKGHNAYAESVKGRTEISVTLEKAD